MKKNKIQIVLNILLFSSFSMLVGSGTLLGNYPLSKNHIILNLSQLQWCNLHGFLSMTFIVLVLTHMLFHVKWAQIISTRYLKLHFVILVSVTIMFFLFIGFVLPKIMTL